MDETTGLPPHQPCCPCCRRLEELMELLSRRLARAKDTAEKQRNRRRVKR